MSLVSLALRVAIVQAVKGRTVAGDRVFDSAIETLDEIITSSPAPIVIVSIDEAETSAASGMTLLSAPDRLTILIEAAVAEAVTTVGTDDAGAETAVVVRAASEGLEATLDILHRQMARALLTPIGAPWSDLWRRFACRIARIERKRGGGADKGTRFASRFLLVTVEPIDDPGFGEAAPEPWSDLIAAMRGGADLAGLAAVMEAEITAPAGLADWRRVQALLGVSEETVRGTGIAPPYADDPEAPPVIESYETMAGPIDAPRADEIAGPEV